jgi:caffeoyl-CoA O-methyltransferase
MSLPMREGGDGLMAHSKAAVEYAARHSLRPGPMREEMVLATDRELGRAYMLSGVLEAGVLTMLVRATRARHVLEIGTLSGVSALAMAAALEPGGRITTCELDADAAALAQQHFDASPFGERVELRLGPALDTIAALPGPFDVVFIDADKGGYIGYYEAVLPKLASHGVIAVDDTLWGGGPADPADVSERTLLMRAFNEHVAADPRAQCVLLPVGDGFTLIWHA